MRYVLSIAALAGLAVIGWVWLNGGLDALAAWAAERQRTFQNTIARALRAARAGETGAVMALLGASFAYGLAHAAGPGHGKVLIGGYGLARRVPVLRLTAIALLASLAQAVTAIVLVWGGILLFDLGRQVLIDTTETLMAPVSYAAIGLIGLWLCWRGLRRLLARRAAADLAHGAHDHGADGVCHSCGHAHGPTLEQVDRVASLREAVLLIGGIAIRPCTGALFVLIITWQMGIGTLGIAGTFAMALGTALVTIAVGLAASGLGGGLMAGWQGSAQAARVMGGIEVLAGAVVALIAGGLLMRAI